jgi:hypothetical protein
MWRTILMYVEDGALWRIMLLGACVPTWILYFYLFFKLIGTLDEQQRKVYTQKAGSYGSSVITIVLFIVFFVLNIKILRLFIAIGIVGNLFWASRRHIQRLKNLEFSPGLIKQFTRTAYLSGLGLVLFFSAIVL